MRILIFIVIANGWTSILPVQCQDFQYGLTGAYHASDVANNAIETIRKSGYNLGIRLKYAFANDLAMNRVVLAFATRDIDKSHTGYKPFLSTYIQRKTL